MPMLSPFLHLLNRFYLPPNHLDAYTRNNVYESSQRLSPRYQSQQRIDTDNTELSCDLLRRSRSASQVLPSCVSVLF